MNIDLVIGDPLRHSIINQDYISVAELTVAISLAHTNIASYLLLHHNVLADRSAIDPVVYSILMSSDEGNAHERRDQLIQMDEFQFILPFYRQSLFFLLEPVEEWVVDDGIRLIENSRLCFEIFQATLQSLGIEYHVIGKDTKPILERVAVVTKLVGF